MDKVKIITKGVFESVSKFEARVNEFSREGWKAISISSDGGGMAVLMERNT